MEIDREVISRHPAIQAWLDHADEVLAEFEEMIDDPPEAA